MSSSPRVSRCGLWLSLGLLCTGVLIHLFWLNAPFGPDLINAGSYFGPFAKSYKHFGFGPLRGVPLVVSPYQQPAEGLLYLSHPPGTAWLLAAFGPEEWKLRLPCVLAVALASLLLFHLLREHLSLERAFLAALLLQVLPLLAVFAQVSYEGPVLAAGLLTLLAGRRLLDPLRRCRWPWWLALVLAASVGPWLDWAYGYFVAALLVLSLKRPHAWRRFRPLAVAGGCALFSVGGVLVWKHWAILAPLFKGYQSGSFLTTFRITVLDRPQLAVLLPELGQQFHRAFDWPLLLLSLPGIVLFFKRSGRLASALLLAGILNALLLARHTAGHVFYMAYLSPLVVAGVSFFPSLLKNRPRLLPRLCLLTCILLAGWRTAGAMRAAASPFFKELGAVLDRESADWSARGHLRRAYLVLSNLPEAYPLYFDTFLFEPCRRLAHLKLVLKRPGSFGVKYLQVTLEGKTAKGEPPLPPLPALETWLAPYPSHAVPQLVQSVTRPLSGITYRVTGARVYTLR